MLTGGTGILYISLKNFKMSRIQRCIPLAAKKPAFVPGKSVPTLLERMQAILVSVRLLMNQQVYSKVLDGGSANHDKKKLVMIGNGMAGVRAIEHLIKLTPEAYEITIFGSEPHPNYNRIMLSSVLAGGADMQEIIINDWDWYKENNIHLYTGHTVTRIDTKNCKVYSDQGARPSMIH